MDMDKEELLINLKVLSQLQKNQKLISRGAYINIEIVSIIPEFIRRWNRQDNRHESIKKINSIVNRSVEFIASWEKDLEDGEINVDLDNMKQYLENALNGIKNLKETYATCVQTCARIDVIINKITDVLKIDDTIPK
jgi:hypothetical protein